MGYGVVAQAVVQTDDELMLSLGAGDQASLGELVSRYQNPLVGYLTGILGDVERARDLSQETFLRVFRHAARYRTTSRFTTWLYHIARNVARDELRTRKRRPVFTAGDERRLAEAPGKATDVAETLARREAVLVTLERLSERDRTLLVLRDIEGRNYDEIASRTGLPLGTVKSGLSRARRRFARSFGALS
jgi:RNA polymerase sigma-70 factor (ECF subfamily)